MFLVCGEMFIFAVAANSCCRVARALCRGGKHVLQSCESTLPWRQTRVAELREDLAVAANMCCSVDS